MTLQLNFGIVEKKKKQIKLCPSCLINKPIADFYKAKSNADTLSSYCKICNSKIAKEWRNKANYSEIRKSKRNLNIERIQDRRRNIKLKEEFLNAYGNRCACCNEDNKLFLTIDHINNDGKLHREQLGTGRGGNNRLVLQDIKKQGFPKDKYRILCFNCNSARATTKDKSCPHELEKKGINYYVGTGC